MEKMNRLIKTNDNSTAALVARIAIAITIFPHGAQKLFGWFGGSGFTGSMYYFTEMVGIPWILGLLVILVEVFASLMLALGSFTRFAAVAIGFDFLGVLLVDIGFDRFFMNWYKIEGQGEGLEYFILLYGLLVVSLVLGGGKASIDALMMKKKVR